MKLEARGYKLQVAILLVSIVLFFGCVKKEQAGQQETSAIPVRAERVVLRDLDKALEYVGTIKAQDEVMVYPKVSGKIIEKVKEEGAPVNKDDTIAYINRDEVGLTFEKAPVQSPVAGVVGRVFVDIGANVLPQTPVALVVSMDTVKINLDIPELYLPQVAIGQEAKITTDAYPQEEFSGKVTKISPIVNLENRAAPLEISVENPTHRLKSGMFVRVALIIERHSNVSVILKESVLGKDPDTYVYVVQNNRAVARRVTLGIRQGPLYEVAQGLKEDEAVVIMGQQRLYDNAPVAVEIGNNNQGGNAK